MVKLAKQEYETFQLDPTWDSGYEDLEYKRVEYGDKHQLAKWEATGFTHKNYTGMMFSDQGRIPAAVLFAAVSLFVSFAIFFLEVGAIVVTHYNITFSYYIYLLVRRVSYRRHTTYKDFGEPFRTAQCRPPFFSIRYARS